MGSNRLGVSRVRVLVALVLAFATACDTPNPSPSATQARPQPSADLPVKVVGDLALEACDPAGLLPCEPQSIVLVEPVAASGVALTYSTEWADGRLDRPTWNASALGLGGWSLDILQRYDPERQIILSGDGSWRFADAVDIGSGERAVPTYDGYASYVFDAAWRHVRTVDSITGAALLTVAYDANGRVTGVTGAGAGTPVSLTVDRGADGALRYLTGPGDTRTATSVGTDGLLAAIGRPDGTLLGVSYAAHGLIASWQSTGRGALTYEWDDAGRLAKATDPDGVWQQLAFEAGDGAVQITVTDPNGGTARFRSERAGDVVRRTHTGTDGAVAQLDTNADGSRRLAQADGTITTVGVTAHPRWGPAAPILSPVVETRPDGSQYRVEATTTMGTGSPTPAGGAWESATTVDGQRWLDAYDPATRTLTRTDPVGRKATQTFDGEGRPTARRMPGEPPVSYAYDAAGVLSSTVVGEGATAATTAFTYANGEVTELRPDGTSVTTVLDAFGRIRRTATAEEHIAVDHEPGGAALQVWTGAHPATSFGYSEGGRETAFLPPAVGEDAWYRLTTYTPAGQVSTMSDQVGGRVEIAYDAAGRASGWTFDEGTSTASYDASTGLLSSNSSPDGVTTSFTYDGWVPTAIAWSGPVTGDVRLTVNGRLEATATSINGGAGLPSGFDAAGLLTSIGDLTIERDGTTGLPTRSTLGDVVTTFEWDSAARLVASTTLSGARTVLTVRYVRDLLGRVTRVDRTDAAGTVTTSSYAYDASGRLGTYGRGAASTTYAYDAAGNRIGATRGQAETTAAFDERDRLTRQGDATYRSSPDGTLLERSGPKGTTAYEFDDLGALRAVVLPDGRRIEYVLDAGGRRIGRKVDGVLTDGYLYGMDDTIVAWTDGSGKVRAQFAYDEGGRLTLVRRDGRDLLVVTDQVGSPIALLDGGTGETVATVSYDAWGNVLGEAASSLLPLGFAGGLHDPATGLVHFGARDYDPATGRWTAPDPLRYDGGDPNLYRYAGGDPVNRVDPRGTTACTPGQCAVAGGAAGPALKGSTHSRGGGTSGGRTYHDRGPGQGTGGTGGKTWHPRGPVDQAGGDNDNTVFPSQRADRPPSGGSVGNWKNSMTTCIGPVCARETRDGVEIYRGAAPGGKNATCLPLCAPPLPGENGKNGWCAVLCGGNDPAGNDGFACIIYCSFGEPHLATADGGRIDFQTAGEFVLARSEDGAYEIQARFEPSRVVRTVSMTTAVTMRVGADRVAMYRNPDSGDPSRALVINGEVISRAQYSTTLPGGGVVERLGADIRVTWPDGSTLAVELYAKFLNVSFAPSDAVAGSLVGLLGTRDGDRANDLTTRDGVVLDPESADFREQLHGRFADSWRIAQAESLFDYRKGETTETFQRIEMGEPATIDDVNAVSRAEAEALCRALGVTADPVLTDCIFDVAVTGDPTFAASAATVAVAVERAAVAPMDLGTAVARDQQVNGELLAGAVDRYHFTAAAGDVVYLDAGAACTETLSWRLFRPNGALTSFSGACNDLGRQVLREAGEWRVELYSDAAAAGPYSFRVVSVPQPKVQAIAPGGSASGTTSAPGEWHRFTLAATAGQVVYLDAEGACDSPLSWRLVRPNGALMAFKPSCEDIGRHVLGVAGTWVIEVYADALETGAYAFRVIGAPGPRERDVSLGDTVTDATTQIGEWHRYGLDGAVGQVLYLDALGACVPGLSWQLLRPDGSLTAFATTCTDMGRQVLDAAGEWTIEIYAPELVSGPYSFKVIGAPAVEQKSIRVGQAVAGAIDAIGEWHRYRLTASAGQKIVIDAQSDCVADLYWQLLKPDGSLTAFATTCTDSPVRTLDVAGDWVIEVYSDTTVTGPYAFTVKNAP